MGPSQQSNFASAKTSRVTSLYTSIYRYCILQRMYIENDSTNNIARYVFFKAMVCEAGKILDRNVAILVYI